MGNVSTPIRPLVNTILGGNLTGFLAEARADGLSFEKIARKLADDHDVDVTGEQVRKWCIESGIKAAA